MKQRWILALSLVLLTSARARAAQLVAIMPVDASHAGDRLNADSQTFLLDALRGAAANAVAGTDYVVLTAARTETEMTKHGVKSDTCLTEWCQTQAARALGLVKFVRTSVHFDDGHLTADVQVIDTPTGSITASIDGEGATVTALRKSLAARIPELFGWVVRPSVETAQAKAPASVTTAATGVPRVVWLNRMKDRMPAAICDTSFFKQCYSATRTECIDAATRSSGPCFEEEIPRLPEYLDKVSGQAWGTKIGECAGVALDDALGARKSTDPKCADASLWQ